MTADFSELQTVLLRERLIHVYSSEFKRASVRSVLEDIVLSEATSYDEAWIDNEKIVGAADYDSLSELKNDTLENFLYRRTLHLGLHHLSQIFLYLEHKGILTADELTAIGDEHENRFTFYVTPKHGREELAIQVPSGEFFWAAQTDRSFKAHVILTARPSRHNYLSIHRRAVSFTKKDSETPEYFYRRCRQGAGDVDETLSGFIVPKSNQSALLMEKSNGDKFYMARVRNDGELGSLHLDQVEYVDGRSQIFVITDKIDDKLQKNTYLRIINSHGDFLFYDRDKNKKKDFTFMSTINLQLDSALILSAKANDITGIIRALLQGADVNARDQDNGYTAMHWVAHNCSDEAFAVLTMRDEEIEPIRNVFLSELTDEFGPLDGIVEKLKSAAEKRAPLAQDAEGYLPSGRINGLNISKSDPENLTKRALWDRLMSVEFKAARACGQNFFDIVGAGGQPFFPGLDVD